MWSRLKHVNSKTKTLADGTKRTYYYAWKGGPRLPDDPTSSEFRRAYDEAWAQRRSPVSGTVAWLIAEFTSDDNRAWASLSERTKADHRIQFEIIKREFGTTTLKRCQEHGARRGFINWRNSMADRPRTADKAMASLSRLFSWAVDQEIMHRNPVAKPGRLYSGSRAQMVWTEADHARFEAAASRPLLDAKLLADETGQRQGDLLNLFWSAYDGNRLHITQSKTGAVVSVLCSHKLKTRLDAMERISTHILTSSHGKPWTDWGFQASWRKTSRRAGITDRTFHDLRGSFVVRAIKAGMTLEQIAQVTGHSMRDLRTLERHYQGRDTAISDAVILAMSGGRK